MRNFRVWSVVYCIEPKQEKVWYKPWKKELKFIVLKRMHVKRWVDYSFGNGGGSFENFIEEVEMATFNDYSLAYMHKLILETSEKHEQ